MSNRHMSDGKIDIVVGVMNAYRIAVCPFGNSPPAAGLADAACPERIIY
ncbi:MAG: hypothetical protein MK171_06035 [Pirellulales bacterium]|nr:hypothetical protein [Pirellulales bacterium]